ncbi:G2/mitotic-specific cyclin S13-6-like [Durio zibethinus]|uniref:G2/mitotic-specific cyclin S13-6-like n=1 Tax=Durio zibethinus TaxID=66656 RepID=A0A6P6BFK6_DURZI|nr:G2/mitotic-specific cyclin S13-6-like [Durio zibethinus]
MLAEKKDLQGRKLKPSLRSSLLEAACSLTNKRKDSIEDIDGADVDNELAIIELNTLMELMLDEGRLHDYMDLQLDTNAKMRSILVDWLMDSPPQIQPYARDTLSYNEYC